jgi:2,4-dienoyl-CoA reductase (NADPH2)
MNLYTGETEEREFDSLVLATTNTPEDRLTKELAAAGLELHAIGDTVAARSASMAFYEGRKLALAL